MSFKLVSEYKPTGDQPQAIKELVAGIEAGANAQTLLGVTGSGKTFTVANVIQQLDRPTLVLSHNKTLAAQLYGEFKQFFPENAVEYFVSYYDYYQPEVYLPVSGTYIEKDLSINDEIEKLRLSTTTSLLSGRRDVIVVSSVSCIYGMGNPEEFGKNKVEVNVGMKVSRNKLLHAFVSSLYSRTQQTLERGQFRVKGDVVDIFPAYADIAYRISFFDDEIEEIYSFDPVTAQRFEKLEHLTVYPANLFVSSPDLLQLAIRDIQDDLLKQVDFFKETGKGLEAHRIEERTTFDLEMIKELGYCPGIENYSRYLDRRDPGVRPFCLLDYFPNDFLTVIDESHVTVPQIHAMYGGDRSRKLNLVEYGFRLPAALDNRPLKFEEFRQIQGQTVYVSATPADFELQESEGVVVEQVIRPTGLLDPIIEVRPSAGQIDDLLEEIQIRVEKDERVLVTTLTKRMAEELTKFLTRYQVKCRYIHSEVDTLERVEIMRDLRLGIFDVLVGVNLLREGLDLPEVSLVAILDADKEGFLRSERSLVQTVGRAARNVAGRAIMYADKITASMQKTIDETERRRTIQLKYNQEHGIVPTQIKRSKESILGQSSVAAYEEEASPERVAAEERVKYQSKDDLEKAINSAKKAMEAASKEFDFIKAAEMRDLWMELQAKRKEYQ